MKCPYYVRPVEGRPPGYEPGGREEFELRDPKR